MPLTRPSDGWEEALIELWGRVAATLLSEPLLAD